MPDPSFCGRLLSASIRAAFPCGRRALLLILGVILVDPTATGCVSLNEPDDCALPCDDSDGCPAGLVCQADMCVRSGSNARCGSPLTRASGGTGAGSPDASVGGSGGAELIGAAGAGGFGIAMGSGGRSTGGEGSASAGGSVASGGADGGPPPRSLPSWLAYISSQSGSSLLHLFDPLSKANLSFPKPPASSPQVTDFQFSPDGRYLAFRVSLAGDPPRLRVLSGPDWTESAFGFGGVTQYGWSPDSRVLAVVYDGGTLLGGAEVSSAAPDGGAAASSVDGGVAGFTILAPSSATITSKLVWFANDAVAFHAPNTTEPLLDNLYFATFEGAEFSSPSSIDDGTLFPPTVEIWPGHLGIYALDPSVPDLSFYLNVGPNQHLNVFQTAFPDPGGLYAARTNGALQVYEATVQNGARAPWAKSAGSCGRILAWAKGRERIACANSTDAGDQAAIFDIDGSTTTLVASPIQGTPAYDENASGSRRRAFSFSGKWLAFTTDSELYVANLAGSAAAVERTYPPFDGTSGSPAELGFSPDETLLLANRAGELTLHPLSGDASQRRLSDELASPGECSEDFLTNPDGWCGNDDYHPHFVWAPNSRFIAVKNAASAIQVWDVKQPPSVGPLTPCAAACADQFQYQPQLDVDSH